MSRQDHNSIHDEHRAVGAPMKEEVSKYLERRLGRTHAKLRLGIEAEHEAQVFGQGITYFHIENLRSSQFVITSLLKLTGLHGRGRRNAMKIQVRRNYVRSAQIPKAFDGYAILHLATYMLISAQTPWTVFRPFCQK